MFYFLDLKKVFKTMLPIFITIIIIYMAFLLVSVRFPVKYYDIIQNYAEVYGVDPVIITSIINVESNFNRNAVSPVGASGLMQIMAPTAVWAAEEIGIEKFDYYEMIFDPEINIKIGTWYIGRLINNYSNLEVALAAYNAGSGNVSRWLTNPEFSEDNNTLSYIPFDETRFYIIKVNINMMIYSFLLGR